MRKNKKGFTLVEVIVVLLIVGILLAITIPSIMGYVGKAKDAQISAEARSGFVAAQTILAKESAKDSTLTDAELADKITAANVKTELNETAATIKDIKCSITSKKLTKCNVITSSSDTKQVTFANGDTTVGAPASSGVADAA